MSNSPKSTASEVAQRARICSNSISIILATADHDLARARVLVQQAVLNGDAGTVITELAYFARDLVPTAIGDDWREQLLRSVREFDQQVTVIETFGLTPRRSTT
ncbi:hypothetical protein GCM10009616_08180 [Microlunatus lacustris]